nr:glycosyltransferase [Cellulomonas hominis]
MPDVVAGGILSLHNLALHLDAQGHRVEVVATRYGSGRLMLHRQLQRLAPHHPFVRTDRRNGYPTTRVGGWALEEHVRGRLRGRAWDTVLLQGVPALDLLGTVRDAGVPTMIRIAALEEVEELGRRAAADPEFAALLHDPLVRVVSNSRFVAGSVAALGLRSPVCYPVLDLEGCTATAPEPHYVTLVNPRPAKGLDIALRVAELLPHRPFLLQESWTLEQPERRELAARLDRLPNVRFAPVTTDMAAVYGVTALLLAPSQWAEAFGRVAVEAAANGIPVVASTSGGLPEAVGDAGVLLEPSAEPRQWADAVEGLLTDPGIRARYAARGVAHARSPRFAPEAVSARFVAVAQDMLAQRAA